MLKLKPSNVTPPDGFRFKCPLDDSPLIRAMDKGDWLRKIRKHYEDNQYELPPDWRERAEDYLCQFLDDDWCYDPMKVSFAEAITRKMPPRMCCGATVG